MPLALISASARSCPSHSGAATWTERSCRPSVCSTIEDVVQLDERPVPLHPLQLRPSLLAPHRVTLLVAGRAPLPKVDVHDGRALLALADVPARFLGSGGNRPSLGRRSRSRARSARGAGRCRRGSPGRSGNCAAGCARPAARATATARGSSPLFGAVRPSSKLERIFLRGLSDRLLDPAAIRHALRCVADEVAKLHGDVADIRRRKKAELTVARKEFKNLVALIRRGRGSDAVAAEIAVDALA